MVKTNLNLLITGANAGLGYHTVLHIARIKGDVTYTTILGARTLEKAKAAVQQILKEDSSISAEKLYPLAIDINSDESITSAAKQVEKDFGHLDILINNAAISESPTAKTERQVWLDLYNTNVIGTQLATEAFIPLLKKSTAPPVPGTRLVNVSSTLSSLNLAFAGRVVEKRYEAYAVSKAALNMTTLYSMHLLQKDGQKIAVVSVCPGFTATKLNNYRGERAPEISALNIVRAATEGSGEEANGKFMKDEGEYLPW